MKIEQFALSTEKPTLLLGLGYVARFLLHSCHTQFRVTSRKGGAQSAGTPDQPKYFNLADPNSWGGVDEFETIVWTFPAAVDEPELRLARAFYESKCLSQKKVMVLASTSAYLVRASGELVDENSPLDLHQTRVRAEEDLRRQGAFILHLAGIFGPGRDPVGWLQKGLIKNQDSNINLIHVSDICKIVLKWIESDGLKGRRMNASDGRHRIWHQLILDLKDAGLLDSSFEFLSTQSSLQTPLSKRVCNKALVEELYAGPFHRYPEDGL